MAVQTNIVPPKKVQSGAVQSSLVQASVAVMQNPMGCEVKANGHCVLPRLSISSRSASMVTGMDAAADGSALHSVMKWKTVVTVFVVVVMYLVLRQSGLLRAGATLREQPEGQHHAGEGPVPTEEPLRLSSRARGPHQGEIRLREISSNIKCDSISPIIHMF